MGAAAANYMTKATSLRFAFILMVLLSRNCRREICQRASAAGRAGVEAASCQTEPTI
jgi:hypothetical protein